MKNIHFLFFMVSAIALSLVSIQGMSQPEKAVTEIEAIMQQSKIIGLSVAVVRKNKIVFTHSFGLKDVEKNEPLKDNHIFRIASISKSFSATSIMQLVEAKKLSLDDDMSSLVGFTLRNPKFPTTIKK